MKPTVGEQLRSARETRGLTLEDAVKATNIRRAYLQELENDHPELLQSTAQAYGFLRLYTSFLGIPSAPLIEQWKSPKVESEPKSIIDNMDLPSDREPQPTETLEAKRQDITDKVNQAESEPEKEKSNLSTGLQEALKRIPKLSQFLPRKKSVEKLEEELAGEHKGSPLEFQAVSSDNLALGGNEKLVTRSSGEILADIGAALRERRGALELTLTDAETFTNVKRLYLEAMEEGRFDELPSTVQGRGMLNNYSQFLALDESWIMDAYAKALLALRAEKERGTRRKIQPPLTVRLNIPPKLRSILNPDLIIGGVFIVALFVFIIWGGAQVFTASKPTPTDAPSISEVLQQTPTTTEAVELSGDNDGTAAVATPIPGVTILEQTPTVIATVNAAPLQVFIISNDRAFLQVVVDGVEEFNGRVASEDVYTFSGEETISLLTGNGAALEVYFNQEYLGNLGNVGEVVDITFSLQGLSTPTPLPTGTPTPDLRLPEGDAMEEN